MIHGSVLFQCVYTILGYSLLSVCVGAYAVGVDLAFTSMVWTYICTHSFSRPQYGFWMLYAVRINATQSPSGPWCGHPMLTFLTVHDPHPDPHFQQIVQKLFFARVANE